MNCAALVCKQAMTREEFIQQLFVLALVALVALFVVGCVPVSSLENGGTFCGGL